MIVNQDFDANSNGVSIRCRLPCSKTIDCSKFSGIGTFNVTYGSGLLSNQSFSIIPNSNSLDSFFPLNQDSIYNITMVNIDYLS